MPRVVGIRFKTAGKIYYFDPGELELAPNDGAVVETARGLELGTVALSPKEVPEEQVKAPLKKVVRKATPEDRAHKEENEQKTKRAFQVGMQKIAAHGLPMKLVDVECTLDGSKITFYFTAENRVDFRDLVKDLASTFRTRIELRQIGVRDEAKLLGGLGCCGRQLCCQAFLGDFVPVSIKMAKEQNLSLNPTKISGICGRLMCCLNFESEAYREAKRAAAANRQEANQAPAAEAAQVEPEPAVVEATTEADRGPASRGAAPAGESERSGAAKRRRRRKRSGEREAGAEKAEKAEGGPAREEGRGSGPSRPQGQGRGASSGRNKDGRDQGGREQSNQPRPAAPAPGGEGQPENAEGREGASRRRRRPRRRRPNGGAPAGEAGKPEGSPGE